MIEFKYQYEPGTPEVKFVLPKDSDLTEVLDQVGRFLLASGYVFDGIVDIIPRDYPQDPKEGSDE